MVPIESADLSYKNIDVVNIYGCNSGNLSEYVRNNANIASKLSKKVSGDVYAYDGNVAFGQTCKGGIGNVGSIYWSRGSI